MSPDSIPPHEIWLNALAELLRHWPAPNRNGRQDFVVHLCRNLRNLNCYTLIGWVVGGEPCPEMTEELERAALAAVLRAFEPVWVESQHPEPLSSEQSQWLRRMRSHVRQLVEARLEEVAPSSSRLVRRKLTLVGGKPPTELQREIWVKLDGKALSLAELTEALGKDDGSWVQKSHLKPMMETDPPLVLNDKAVGGYYRPDSPPSLE